MAVNIASREAGSYTEAGTKDRLMMLYGNTVKWCSDSAKWFMYNKETTLWKEINKDKALKMVENLRKEIRGKIRELPAEAQANALKYVGDADKSFQCNLSKLSNCKAALEFMKAEVSCSESDFDARQDLLGLPNGKVYDALNGKVIDGDPKFLLTKQLMGTPRADFQISDRFKKYIEVFLPDEEVRSYLQKYLGSSFLGIENRNPSDKRGVFIQNLGNTGKSMFLHALSECMGEYYRTSVIGLLTEAIKDSNKPNALLGELRGVRIAGISEVKADSVFATDNFKRVTGGDILVGRSPYSKEPFYFRSEFRLLVMSNTLPRPDDGDDKAFRSRFRRINRDKALSEIDESLEKVIRTQDFIDDFVTWLADGCRKYLQCGGKLDNYDGQNLQDSNLPADMKRAIAEYIGQNDEMLEFFGTYYTRADSDSYEFLESIYKNWLEYTNDKKTTFNMFCRTFRQLIQRLGLREGRVLTEEGKPRRLKCVYGVRQLVKADIASKAGKISLAD